MLESFGITAYLEAYDSSQIFWWARSSNRSSVFVICHNSLPYNKIGRQKVLYSLCVVMGCRQPNLEPTALQLKKALLPALQCSEVRADDDGETVRRIPRWCWLPFSGIFSPETNHCRRGRFFTRVAGDSPITTMADLSAFKLYRHCRA